MSQLTKNGQAGVERKDDRLVVRPAVDVLENDAEFLIVLDVAGATRETVDVRFDSGELTIEARRVATPSGRQVAAEFRAGDYRRGFALPDSVDPEHITAELAQGVLSVHVPKAASRRARRIEVRTT